MEQVTNIYIDIRDLTYKEKEFVNEVFHRLTRGKKNMNIPLDRWIESYPIWSLDRNGDRMGYESIENLMQSWFSFNCEPIVYTDILVYASKLGLIEDHTEKQETVDKPNHYQLLPEYQVRDINKAILDKVQGSDFDMSLDEAGWFQQAMQYFMRFYAKNGIEDLEKGVYAMNIVIESLKEKGE